MGTMTMEYYHSYRKEDQFKNKMQITFQVWYFHVITDLSIFSFYDY